MSAHWEALYGLPADDSADEHSLEADLALLRRPRDTGISCDTPGADPRAAELAAEQLARARAQLAEDRSEAATEFRWKVEAAKQARALRDQQAAAASEDRRAYFERLAGAAIGCDESPLDICPDSEQIHDTGSASGVPSSGDPVCPVQGPPRSGSRSPELGAPKADPGSTRRERSALTKNPRKLRYWRGRMNEARIAMHRANELAEAGRVSRLVVPREVYDVCASILDDTAALAGALDWIRQTFGPGVVTDVEAAALFRERGGFQHDDWSCARARRKASLLTMLLFSPHELERSVVTGSASGERVIVTAGVPQTCLVAVVRSSQREPYCTRTLQRDLAEIDRCSELLLRWKTPAAHAEAWECQGDGVVNRYCARVRMIREQWGRAASHAEAIVKQACLRVATWMVWRPAPARGSPVPWLRGCVPAPG